MNRVWLVISCAVLALAAGCKTKQQSHRPPPAYMPPASAQEMSLPPMMQDPRMAVMVRGDVRNSIVPWNEDLTLARAILAADYYGQRDPHSIALIRNGRSRRISTSRLLGGEDMFLEPGDIVEIRR